MGTSYDTAQTGEWAEMGLMIMGRGCGLRSPVSLVRALRTYGCTRGSAQHSLPSWCDLIPHNTLGFEGYLL